jgi:diguanylate cyclase (GGDEF)-like protein
VFDSVPEAVGVEAPTSDTAGMPVSTSTAGVATLPPVDGDAPSESGLPSGRPRRWRLPPHDDPRAESTIRAFAGGLENEADDERTNDAPAALLAPAPGFATRRAWNEAFRHEEQRLARYGGRVTLVVTEIDGLDAFAAVFGQEAADRHIRPVEAMMRRNARAADVTARFGRSRFVALLPETDEIAAINYIERVRSECDAWLEAQSPALRLAIGWAQPGNGGSLAEALRVADERMNADRYGQVLGTQPTTAAVARYEAHCPLSSETPTHRADPTPPTTPPPAP